MKKNQNSSLTRENFYYKLADKYRREFNLDPQPIYYKYFDESYWPEFHRVMSQNDKKEEQYNFLRQSGF